MKQCSKCCETKQPEQFQKRKDSKDGLRCVCRACISAVKSVYSKTYRVVNKQKIKEKKAAYYCANIQSFKNRARNNRERRRELGKQWIADNKESVNERRRVRVAKLSDSYIRQRIGKDACAELIEVKRMHLKIIRAIKERRDEIAK